MDARTASDRIRRAAVLGDRARRTANVARAVTRLAVPVAAFAGLTTVLSTFLRGPRWAAPSVVGGTLAFAATAFALARVRRPVSDRVAAELDRAADLGGGLRSACWFVASSSPPDGADAAWRDFHLVEVARRVSGVDWNTVYPIRIGRRVWLIACGLLAASVVAARGPAGTPPVSVRPSSAVEVALPPTPGIAEVINTPALTDGIRAMKSGRVPSTEALAAVGHALSLAKSDAAAKDQLDRLFNDTRADRPVASANGQPTGEEPDVDERSQALVNPWAVEWAYQDAVSRASAARPSGRDVEPVPSRNAVVPQDHGNERRDPTTGKGSMDGAAVPGQARGQTAGFSSLLFGRQQADADGARTSAPDRAGPRTAALTMALRQEVIRAGSDNADAQMPSSARRAAANESFSAGTRSTGAAVQYDRGRGSQPPIIPEQRRSFVHDVFLRPADAPAPRPE